jgi:sugar lactone lactonase YvrE
VPLAVSVAAAFALDLLWPILLLLGWESVRVNPGDTAFTGLAFDSYPWTHSLLLVTGWSVLAALIGRRLMGSWKSGALLGALVMSHWMLDFVTHRPDLPLWPGGPRVGLGLWNSVPGTILVEATLLALGIWLYANVTAPRDRAGRWSLVALVAVTSVVWVTQPWAPPPPTATAVALGAFVLWLLPPWSAWIERHRLARRLATVFLGAMVAVGSGPLPARSVGQSPAPLFEATMIFPTDRSLTRPEDGIALPDGRLVVADQVAGLRLVETDGTTRPFGRFEEAGYEHDPPARAGGPNGVSLDASGTRILVADVFRGGIYRVDIASEATERIYQHRYGVNAVRSDRHGGIWFTQSTRNDPENGEEELFRSVAVATPDGALYYLPSSPPGESTEAVPVVEGLEFANGLALDEDAGVLYLSETMASKVHRFRFDAASGRVRDRTVALEVNHPDNLELDSRGRLWIASPVHSEIIVFDPATGVSQSIFRISTPASARLIETIEAQIREGTPWLDALVPALWEPGPGLITGMILTPADGPVYLTGLGDALIRWER